jgi:hypothetical protein
VIGKKTHSLNCCDSATNRVRRRDSGVTHHCRSMHPSGENRERGEQFEKFVTIVVKERG